MEWTKEDIILLVRKFGSSSWKDLADLFPGRSKGSIKKEAHFLGLKRSRFSTQGGSYLIYFMCDKHGRILRTEVSKWVGEEGDIPLCPHCGRRLRRLPKAGFLRRKYRDE